MEQVNYSHPVEGSQHYTDLAQLLQTMKALRKRINLHLLQKEQPYSWDGITDEEPYKTSAEEDVAYIIKGLENSIQAGYKIVDPAPEGMMTIHAPVGSHIITPNMEFIPISAQVFESMGFHYDGVCWYRDGVYIGNYKGGYFHVPQTLANRGEKILYKHQVERLLNEHRK